MTLMTLMLYLMFRYDATTAVGASPPPPEQRTLHGSPSADPDADALAIILNGEKIPLTDEET